MNSILLTRLLKSTVGKKFLMAVSGMVLFLFAVVHMIGNLQVFIGPEAINRYAHFLQSNMEFLWPSRFVLLALVLIHIGTSISLTISNRRARPRSYQVRELVGASLASRTMIVTGLLIAAYVVYHILQFTTGTVDPSFESMIDPVSGHHDVYRMVITGFSNPLNSIGYIAAMGFLCLHLSHGIGAMFQSLGLKNQVYEGRIKGLSKIIAVVLFAGYSIVPLSILLGWIG